MLGVELPYAPWRHRRAAPPRLSLSGRWIAKDDPAAARHAVTGRADLADLDAALVLSNGVSRLVDPYETTSWSDLVGRATQEGPEGVLAEVRAAEQRLQPANGPDDASLAVCTFS